MNNIIKEEDIKFADQISKVCTFDDNDRKAYICLNNHFAENPQYEEVYSRHLANYFTRNFKDLMNGNYKKIPFSSLHKQISEAIHNGENGSSVVIPDIYQRMKARITTLNG